MLTKPGWTATCLAGLVWTISLGMLRAQAADESPPASEAGAANLPDGDTDPPAAGLLVVEQQQVADKFRHLEEVLLRMAELTASTDPRRAALLKKVVAQSEERLVDMQFEAIVELLTKDSLSRAIENQDQIEGDLRALLELLLSENRAERIESEKARIRNYLKKLNQIIRRQKGLQGRTAGGGGKPKSLAEEQGKLAKDTGGLAGEMKQNEQSAGGSAAEDEDKSKENQADGERKGEGSDDKSKGKGQPSGETEGKGQGEPEDAPEGKSPRGRQPQGQGQRSDQGGAQDGNEISTRKRVEAARKHMEEARRKLEEASHEGAVEKQEEAIRELEQAKADLEKILRQLREEEIERVLAVLKARFMKMLQVQQAVYEGTLRLDKVPGAERDHNHQIEASRLSTKEAEIVLEASEALALLREDGTAAAFPEAVEQMRGDMEQVVQRLARAKVDKITQAIEEDIIAALEEMIEALKKALEDAQAKDQPPDGPPGEPQEPPLVDLLAELKMIRALQMRVNRRTERYSKLIDGEQADTAELLEALDRLAQRQQRIYQVTRDLEMGKNR